MADNEIFPTAVPIHSPAQIPQVDQEPRRGRKLTTTRELQDAGWILKTDEYDNDYFEHKLTKKVSTVAPHVTPFDTWIYYFKKNPKYFLGLAFVIFVFFIWLRALFDYA